MLKKMSVLLCVFLFLVMLSNGVLASNELKILNWPVYFNMEVIEDFEEEYNVDVTVTEYGSSEELNGYLESDDYDIIITAEFVLTELIANGMLESLDKSKISNFNNLNPWFTNLSFDRGNKYTIPYTYLFVGLAYNADKFSSEEVSLQTVFEPGPELKGRIHFYPDSRIVTAMAMRYIGKSINSTNDEDLELAQMLLANLKQNAVSGAWNLEHSVDDATLSLANGDADVAITFASENMAKALLAAYEVEGNIKCKLPESGGYVGTDNMMIVKDAPNIDLAYKFIDFLLEPENAVENVITIGLPMPVNGVQELLPNELKDDDTLYPPAELLKKFETFEPISGEEYELYVELWNNVK
ncbi:MAG: spermidine/putrescine ABC transporter substrate-binding protein [Halanaerobiales bacterium]|nr:spermidine/putrescine ABC transporter substrate-binding protein [Halanaerobiales bacterium]